MRVNDTIAAPATPAAPAARAIVRTSGPLAFDLLATLSPGGRPAHQSATQRSLRLSDGIDVPTTVYAFVGPRSATGEDVIEYHLPGSPLFVKLLLARLFDGGARLAEPGEFTARAFFNARLDLSSAEGVAATIAAASRAELDAARQLLAGEMSRRLWPILDALIGLVASLEAMLDFADEPVDAVADDAIAFRIRAVDEELSTLLRDAPRIERLSHEPRIVLTGRPNAGKSTLLNALAGDERAVVSDVAGTTRDALSTRVRLRRGTVTLVDTAGLDDAPSAGDAIDRQMQAAAVRESATSDVLVRVVALDDRDADTRAMPSADLVVYTKRDLVAATDVELAVSAATGEGLDRLSEAIDRVAFGRGDDGQSGRPTLAVNARHVAAIAAAQRAMATAIVAGAAGPEFVAAALREACSRLDEVGHGGAAPDDILGRIFASFCIGK